MLRSIGSSGAVPGRLAERLLVVATGIGAGLASGLLIINGRFVVLAVGVVWCVTAMALSWAVVPADQRWRILPLVGFAAVLRAAIAVVLYDGLTATGRGGFLTGDDQGYADLSSRLARLLHGEAANFSYMSEGYLLGAFVYLETALFYLFGPDVLIVELLNAAMGGLVVTFVFEIGRRIFHDARAGATAAALVTLYPSLVLWSALNLKDTLGLLLIAITIWLLVVFRERLTLWLIPFVFIPTFLMETVRGYMFVVLAVIVPLSVIVAPLTRPRRLGAAIIAIALTAVLLVDYFSIRRVPSLSDFESGRAAMGAGANTNFAAICASDGAGEFERTVRYVPCATMFVVFAPFPWSVSRTLDLLFVPEMIVWYATLAADVVVILRYRRLWRSQAPVITLIGGTFLVFILAEGNVGTLFRHRAMLVPFALILAAPALDAFRRPPHSSQGDRVIPRQLDQGMG